MSRRISGAHALALGAIQAGVSLVTGYPGSPATAVVNRIIAATSPEEVRVEWASNEKVGVEMAFGASLAGVRSLLCVKSVGLNVALDPLMVYNLSGCRAGLVVLLGDDPGGWGSQNEQDSRALAPAAQLPLFEPATVADARRAVAEAFRLSQAQSLPAIVRFTRALAVAEEGMAAPPDRPLAPALEASRPEAVVLPVDVVRFHLRLLEKLRTTQATFERSALNGIEGAGSRGVIAAGFAYQKLKDVLGGAAPKGVRLLRLGTPYPLPEDLVTGFLRPLEAVLVLEETAPLVEEAVRAAAQRDGLSLPVYGRLTGQIPGAGELLPSHIAAGLRSLVPSLPLEARQDPAKAMPSRTPLCNGCPYTPTFQALVDVMEQLGGRDRFIVTGDPGCMVRAQLPPLELFDVKHGLGSSIGMATGLALGQAERRVISLAGDSSFLHTGFNGLLDAARSGVRLLVIILDNGTIALTGGQPHPGTPRDARGRPRPAVDIAGLAREAGAGWVRVIDARAKEEMQGAIHAGLEHDGVAVIVARGACPRT